MKVIKMLLTNTEHELDLLTLMKQKVAGKALLNYGLYARNIPDAKHTIILDDYDEQISKDIKETHDVDLVRYDEIFNIIDDEIFQREGYALIVKGNLPLLKEQNFNRLIENCHANQAASALINQTDSNINYLAFCITGKVLSNILKNVIKFSLENCASYLIENKKNFERIRVSEREAMEVDSFVMLAQVESYIRDEINLKHMNNGVRLIDPANSYIDGQVIIEPGVVIYPGNVIEGNSYISSESLLLTGNYIEDAQIGKSNRIGPNAHLRPKTITGNFCRIGNFVELKNVLLEDYVKVSHLAYCGDGEIGESSNISCGVIFSNYNGSEKAYTKIGKNVFVGCNSNLVAPVSLGAGAYIAAGSTITQDVPEKALAIARERQIIKEGWTLRPREEA